MYTFDGRDVKLAFGCCKFIEFFIQNFSVVV